MGSNICRGWRGLKILALSETTPVAVSASSSPVDLAECAVGDPGCHRGTCPAFGAVCDPVSLRPDDPASGRACAPMTTVPTICAALPRIACTSEGSRFDSGQRRTVDLLGYKIAARVAGNR